MPVTKRDQYMALSALGSIALAVLFYMYVWDPKRIELDATQAHVDSVVVLNQRAKSELAQGKTQELKAEADRLTSDLEVMRRLVPTGNEVPALLEQVSTAASASTSPTYSHCRCCRAISTTPTSIV
jgi:type IV pilus assembly protein PilO